MRSNKLAITGASSNALYLRRVKSLDLGKKRDASDLLGTSCSYLFLSVERLRFSAAGVSRT